MRRLDVFVVYRLRLVEHAGAQRLLRLRERRGVAALGGRRYALVVLHREFRVDGQVDGRAALAAARKHDGELHALPAAGARLDVLRVLLLRQHLLKQGAELHFAPRSARLDVREDLLQIADVGGQRAHLAEPLVYLLEPLGDRGEGLAEPFFERRVKLLVHGRAHLFELFLVALLHLAQLFLDGRAHRLELVLVEAADVR